MKDKEFSLLNKIFFFDFMITPRIITFIYWIMLIGATIGALGVGINEKNPLYAALILIGCFIVFRIWCEVMIVLFKINENIQKIADRSDSKPETDIF